MRKIIQLPWRTAIVPGMCRRPGEERLAFTDDSPVGIECENCGAMIKTGRFCDACKSKLQNNLMSAIDKPKKVEPKKPVRDGERMRFLEK